MLKNIIKNKQLFVKNKQLFVKNNKFTKKIKNTNFNKFYNSDIQNIQNIQNIKMPKFNIQHFIQKNEQKFVLKKSEFNNSNYNLIKCNYIKINSNQIKIANIQKIIKENNKIKLYYYEHDNSKTWFDNTNEQFNTLIYVKNNFNNIMNNKNHFIREHYILGKHFEQIQIKNIQKIIDYGSYYDVIYNKHEKLVFEIDKQNNKYFIFNNLINHLNNQNDNKNDNQNGNQIKEENNRKEIALNYTLILDSVTILALISMCYYPIYDFYILFLIMGMRLLIYCLLKLK
jgi:hypothetical protein